jgi:membrane protein
MTSRESFTLLRQTVADWIEDKAPQLGAALAFYTALSLAPLLVIALAVAGLVFDARSAREQLGHEIQSLVGKEGAAAINDMIESASSPAMGSAAAALGFITLLFGASGVFGQLQESLNVIWEVRRKGGRGLWGLIKDRFLSFAMVLGVAFLLLTSLLLSTALSAFTSLVGVGEATPWLAQAATSFVSFAVTTLLFALIFKVLPDVTIAWRDVWLGALVTSGLFTIGKVAIGAYLGHSAMASSYGVAGSFVVLLVWTYYSAQIVFFGAEFTQVYAKNRGSEIVPTAIAERIPYSS